MIILTFFTTEFRVFQPCASITSVLATNFQTLSELHISYEDEVRQPDFFYKVIKFSRRNATARFWQCDKVLRYIPSVQNGYLGRNHADELLVGTLSLLINVVGVTGHFLEVAGSLVDQGVQSRLLWPGGAQMCLATFSEPTVRLIAANFLLSQNLCVGKKKRRLSHQRTERRENKRGGG